MAGKDVNRPSRFRFPFCAAVLLLTAALAATLASPQATGGPPLRFAVIGDSGTGDRHQYRVAQQMLAWHDRFPYPLVLMLGDNIYGGLFNLGGGNKNDFPEKFDKPYAPLRQRGVVFRAALGNHDLRHDDGRDLIQAYDRFHIEGEHGYYSFTAGEREAPAGETLPLVEFFVINTVRIEKNKHDPAQLAWLEDALAASRARWRILYGHHPLYSTGDRHGSDPALREKLLPILLGPAGEDDAPRVHVVLAGHDHIYQRFHPQHGIHFFVCGSSGKLRRGDAEPDPRVAAAEDQQRAFMLWEAASDELRFFAINERGHAFDCGAVRAAGRLTEWRCPALSAGPRAANPPAPTAP